MKIRMPAGDRRLNRIFLCVVTLYAAFCLLPFLLMIVSSFTDEVTLLRYGYTLFPRKLSAEAYRVIFHSPVIFRAYEVTIFITVVGTLLSLAVTSALAYAIQPRTVKYRNAITFFIYITMLFNGGLVATYILIAKYLNLKNTVWVMILPALVNPWNMFLLRNFFKTIPDSLSESARIDGASDLSILVKIVLPLSKPSLATVGLFYALGYWNEWFRALLFIEREDLATLQLIIMRILRSVDAVKMIPPGATFTVQAMMPSYTARLALTLVTIGPIVLLYPFLQKYFVKGVMVGAIRG